MQQQKVVVFHSEERDVSQMVVMQLLVSEWWQYQSNQKVLNFSTTATTSMKVITHWQVIKYHIRLFLAFTLKFNEWNLTRYWLNRVFSWIIRNASILSTADDGKACWHLTITIRPLIGSLIRRNQQKNPIYECAIFQNTSIELIFQHQLQILCLSGILLWYWVWWPILWPRCIFFSPGTLSMRRRLRH